MIICLHLNRTIESNSLESLILRRMAGELMRCSKRVLRLENDLNISQPSR
jgi:hypothetical protein